MAYEATEPTHFILDAPIGAAVILARCGQTMPSTKWHLHRVKPTCGACQEMLTRDDLTGVETDDVTAHNLQTIEAATLALSSHLFAKAVSLRYRWDRVAQYLATCHTYGWGCETVIDTFVQAVGYRGPNDTDEDKGWSAVWALFAKVMREERR